MTEKQDQQITETLELGLTVGCVIRDARKKTKQKIKTISEALKISSKYLEGIEKDDYTGFPGDAYMMGFVKNYANYLGLDGEAIVKQLIKEQFANKKAHVFNKMGQKIEPISKKASISDKFIRQDNGDFSNIGLIILAVVVLFIVVIFSLFNKSDNIITPTVMEEINEEMVIEDNVTLEDISDVDFMPNIIEEVNEDINPLDIVVEEIVEEEFVVYGKTYINNSRLVVNVIEDSWIEIFDKEAQKVLFTGVFAENDKIVIPNRAGIIMKTGNAGGIELIFDNKVLKSIGKRGVVSDYISLLSENLEKEYYKPEKKKKETIKKNRYRLN